MALFSLSFSLSAALSLSSINKIPFDLAIISKSGFRLFRKFWPTKLHAQHTNSRPSNGAQLFVSINFRSKSDFFLLFLRLSCTQEAKCIHQNQWNSRESFATFLVHFKFAINYIECCSPRLYTFAPPSLKCKFAYEFVIKIFLFRWTNAKINLGFWLSQRKQLLNCSKIFMRSMCSVFGVRIVSVFWLTSRNCSDASCLLIYLEFSSFSWS